MVLSAFDSLAELTKGYLVQCVNLSVEVEQLKELVRDLQNRNKELEDRLLDAKTVK